MSLTAWASSAMTWCAPSSLPVTTNPATRLNATGSPSSSVSESIASIRSMTRLTTLEGWPNQVGVASTRISDESSFSWTGGHSSPSPSSDETPGSRLRSTARIISQVAPPASRASRRTTASASVFEAAGEGLRVQLSMRAWSGTPPLTRAGENQPCGFRRYARPVSRGPNEPLIGLPGSRSELGTPALVLDLDVLDANIAPLAAHARTNGYALRPVAKVHKSIDIARRQIAAGGIGVCCATLAEAEAMAGAGIPGV